MQLNGQEIIDLFEVYVDDTSELSSVEELALLNRIYHRIARNRPWEFLRTEKTGTLSTSVPYVALPSDFLFLTENNQTSDSITGSDSDATDKVVFVGSSRTPYRIVNYADRYRYENSTGYAYIDLANSRLVFTKQPTTAESYVYDYIKIPTNIALDTYPAFPICHEMIAYGMAVDGYIIQIFDKARSYAPENNAKFDDCMRDLAFYNANLRND